ncbi:anaphase promoting complex subunit 4 [Cavenderia fasciculata]|uniref:Anaphase-promoting complex subunit 4 n=1 Tax=Cavenderia fasciculata TaxID=261658 RepID=F4PRX5_CACFS|nr:anaphase promoting complex subunit 4 [Cavenderia fasciculata]EGG21411.1 anaphase promoting complex subunit 4 [Cavenderia fasciculata]|eukprot:XP_004359261.1 anaphase promoting complex subunit 4 [Cavenderia fasciculata]
MDTDNYSNNRSFVPLNDKVSNNDIKIAACCPMMDLLSIAQSSSSITIHRFLNWQRLLSITSKSSSSSSSTRQQQESTTATTTDEKVTTAMQWSPNGKIIASGYSNGTMTLYSIENGKEIHSIASTSSTSASPITLLQWIQFNDLLETPVGSTATSLSTTTTTTSNTKFSDNELHSDYFPSLQYYINEFKESDIKPFPLKKDLDVLDVLISCNEKGIISFYIIGIVHIGNFNIMELLLSQQYVNKHVLLKGCKSIQFHSIAMSTSFNQLTVVVETDNGLTVMIDIDTSILYRQCQEIFKVALHYSTIEWLLETTDIILHDVIHRWEETQQMISAKWDIFEKLIRDYGRTSTIEQEILDLLMTGVASPPTCQFISNHIDIKIMKSMQRNCESIRETLINLIQNAYSCTLHSISQLHTFSLWSEKYGDILNSQSFEHLLTASNKFGIQLETLEITLSQLESQYSNLFTWFLKVQNQLTTDKTKLQQPQQQYILNELLLLSLLENGVKYDPIINGQNTNKSNKTTDNSNQQPISKQFKQFKQLCLETTSFNNLNNQSTTNNIINQLKITTFTPISMFDNSKLDNQSQFFKSSFLNFNNQCNLSIITPMNNKIFIGKKKRNEWHFSFIQLSMDDRVVDMCFFDQSNLLVLTTTTTQDKSILSLLMYNCGEEQVEEVDGASLYYQQLPVTIPPNTIMVDLLDATFFDQESCTTPLKNRFIKSSKLNINKKEKLSLNISSQRKVACVIIGTKRTVLYDIAEDEEIPEDDGDEDEEDQDEE